MLFIYYYYFININNLYLMKGRSGSVDPNVTKYDMLW